MTLFNKLLLTGSLLGVSVLVAPATAQTSYTNQSGSFGYFNYFGAGHPYDAPIVGQVFTAPTGTLQSWTFYDDSAATSGATFAVAAWNGSTVTGSDLFSSASSTVTADPSTGFYAHTVSGINLALTAGQSYYAYLTTYNTPSPVVSVSVEDTTTTPLGGYAAFSLSAGAPAGAAYTKYNTSDYRLDYAYTATFGAAAAPPAVPEPAAWAMMIVGFGAVGVGLRRRGKQVARVAHA